MIRAPASTKLALDGSKMYRPKQVRSNPSLFEIGPLENGQFENGAFENGLFENARFENRPVENGPFEPPFEVGVWDVDGSDGRGDNRGSELPVGNLRARGFLARGRRDRRDKEGATPGCLVWSSGP